MWRSYVGKTTVVFLINLLSNYVSRKELIPISVTKRQFFKFWSIRGNLFDDTSLTFGSIATSTLSIAAVCENVF